jgi:imidazolonepropionase
VRNPVPLLLVNIRQLLTLDGPPGPRRGHDLSDLGIIEDAAVLCAGGRIVSVGKTSDARGDSWLKGHGKKIREIDCAGKVVLPGFADSHTHPLFAAPRLVDFEKRIAGATYEEIAAAGGGIRSSITAVRNAPQAQLAAHALASFNRMLAQGTTTVEAKSGYGLSIAAEMKSLEAIRDASQQWPGTVVPTLLAAHVVPPEFSGRAGEYIRTIVTEAIPQAAKRKLAQFVDVFCDRGAFTIRDAEQVFFAARQHGLGARAHLSQLTRSELAPLLRYDPASLDHLDYITESDIDALLQQAAVSPAHQSIATLLPGANFFLGLPQYPPARKLIDAGVAVALATDFNPGTSPTTSMPFVLSLACTQMKMSPAEAIAASTINGAHALRLADRKGSIAPGKDADLAIFDVEDYREIPYWVAENRCIMTIAGGQIASGSALASEAKSKKG